MQNPDKSFEFQLVKSLRKCGLILPNNESDLEDFNKKLINDDIPPIPDSLNDPEAIQNRGYVSKQYPTDVSSDYKGNMAFAARAGKSISMDILKKMRKDREDAEKNAE